MLSTFTVEINSKLYLEIDWKMSFFYPNQVHKTTWIPSTIENQSADSRLKTPDRGTKEKVNKIKTLGILNKATYKKCYYCPK